MRQQVEIPAVVESEQLLGIVAHGVGHDPEDRHDHHHGDVVGPLAGDAALDLDLPDVVEGAFDRAEDPDHSPEEHDQRHGGHHAALCTGERLFGERDDNQAIVRIDKGEDENTIVSSDGYPDFEVNEKVLLFLSRDDSDIATDEDYYVLTGMRQGKYDLSESENSRSSNTINTYISSMEVDNERDTEVIDELKDKIEKEHNMHPNYSEEQKQRQIEIDNENKKLFGE